MMGSLRDQTLSKDSSRQSMQVGRRTRKHPEATWVLAAVPTAMDRLELGMFACSDTAHSFFLVLFP